MNYLNANHTSPCHFVMTSALTVHPTKMPPKLKLIGTLSLTEKVKPIEMYYRVAKPREVGDV